MALIPRELSDIKDARNIRDSWDRTYRENIRKAYSAGFSYADIGRFLGISRQAVREIAEKQ